MKRLSRSKEKSKCKNVLTNKQEIKTSQQASSNSNGLQERKPLDADPIKLYTQNCTANKKTLVSENNNKSAGNIHVNYKKVVLYR